MDTTKGFKEAHLTREAEAAWQASPQVAQRIVQVRAFAKHQGLKFDAEGLSRINEFWAALDQTQGPTPMATDFLVDA